MLKASIIAAIGGLLLTKVRWPHAWAGILALAFGEMVYLLASRPDVAQALVDFAILDVVAQMSWLFAFLVL